MSFGKVKSNFYPFGEFPLDNEIAAIGFPLVTKYANVDVNVNVTLSLPGGANCIIYWGDDTTSAVIGPQVTTAYNHIYANALLDYDIRISGDVDTITSINVGSDPYSGDIANFAIFTSLTNLFIQTSNIGGDIASISGLTNLVQILAFTCPLLGGDIASFSGMVNMLDMRINNTPISGDFASCKTMTLLTFLRIYLSNINNYTASVLPNWDAATLSVYSVLWTTAEVSNFWIDLDASSVASIKTVRGDGTNGALNAAGLVADASLIVKGWTTIHN